MVHVTVSADCGNSPKKEFLKDLNIAYAEGNVTFIAENAHPDITWNMVGDRVIQGLDDFKSSLDEMKDNPLSAIVIHSIITHGKEGAVNGEIVMSDGSKYAFCDVYEFASAKGNSIKSMISYVIELADQPVD